MQVFRCAASYPESTHGLTTTRVMWAAVLLWASSLQSTVMAFDGLSACWILEKPRVGLRKGALRVNVIPGSLAVSLDSCVGS